MPDHKFTPKQGQYLAFVHTYTRINRQPPAINDIAAFFEVTPPSAQRMVDTLVAKRLLYRKPRAARSLRVLVPVDQLPPLG